MAKRIYIVDDEKNIRQLIQSFLIKEGFEAICFEGGKQMLQTFEAAPADLVILDIMMPGIDGLSICTMLRSKSNVPIIIVSAKDGELDRIAGITLGSDDYLVKPFSPLELVARVKALFRRQQMTNGTDSAQEVLVYGDIKLDLKLRKVVQKGILLPLTPTEFDFIAYLLQNIDRAVSKQELLQKLWQFDFEADTRATDDLVKRLRKKLKEHGSNVQIETVWGFGFRLDCGEKA